MFWHKMNSTCAIEKKDAKKLINLYFFEKIEKENEKKNNNRLFTFQFENSVAYKS